MQTSRRLTPLLALILCACGSDDATGPGNSPPYFIEAPAGNAPSGLYLNVVPGDQIGFSARAVDPDIEDVTYRWELGRQVGDEFVLAVDAGSTLGSLTAQMTWTVAAFADPVRVRCTISDGKESRSELVGRTFASASALDKRTFTSNHTLTVAESPYVVVGDLIVERGARLRVEAGVELQVRPDRESGEWEKRNIIVRGILEAAGELGNSIVVRGGFSSDPDPGGGGAEQLKGIRVEDNGQVSLTYSLVREAEIGLRVLSLSPSTVESCVFVACGTGMQIERDGGTTLIDTNFRSNSTGLQLNNSSVSIEGGSCVDNSAFGINVDASTAGVTLDIRGVTFQNNLQAHLRMAGEFGWTTAATVRGSNFLEQSGQTPAINLASNCVVYSLDLRGNYWGSAVVPTDIVQMFADDRSCAAGVLDWTDSDCGDDPEACDWSNRAW